MFNLTRDSGYVAPEYAIHGQLSEKVDTYSFGIVVLEIISGKRCDDVIDDKSVNLSLLDHVRFVKSRINDLLQCCFLFLFLSCGPLSDAVIYYMKIS